MGIETIRRSGVEQPVGYVAEGWVEADNLMTGDEEFVAEAETLKDPAQIGALCQKTFELGVLIRKQATSSADLLSFDERVKRFIDDVSRVTHDAVPIHRQPGAINAVFKQLVLDKQLPGRSEAPVSMLAGYAGRLGWFDETDDRED